MDIIEQLKSSDKLPSPSSVGLKILQITEDADFSMQDLAKVLQSDPALTGRLIKVANSAVNGPSEPILKVDEAVMRLGVRTVRNLALIQVFPEVCSRIAERCEANPGEDPSRFQKDELGIDEYELNAILFKDWGFPDLFAKAVYLIGNPETDERPGEKQPTEILANIIRYADFMSSWLAAGEENPSAEDRETLIHIRSRLQMDSESFIGLLNRITEEWSVWGKSLELNSEIIPSLAEIKARSRISSDTFIIREEAHETIWQSECPLRILFAGKNRFFEKIAFDLAGSSHDMIRENSPEAILKYNLEFHPHLILLAGDTEDYEVNGFIKTLKNSEINRDVYILTFLKEATTESIDELFSAGSDQVVIMPYHLPVIRAHINTVQKIIDMSQKLEKEALSHSPENLSTTKELLPA